MITALVKRRMASALNAFAEDNPAPRSADAMAALERLVSEFSTDIRSAADADGIAIDADVLHDVEQLTTYLKEGTDPMRHSIASRRHRRDEFAPVDPLLAVDPALDPSLDPAIAEIVSTVEVVDPMTKRYRATITRTITESAVVEFDALETEDLNAVANALVQALPPDAWVDNAAADYGWIDRIEEVSVAAVDPALETLDSEEVPLDDEEEAPVTLGRGRRRRGAGRRAGFVRQPRRGTRASSTRRFMRMTAADATTAAEEITAELDALSTGQDLSDPVALDAYIASLNALAAEVSDALAAPIEEDGIGDVALATDALTNLENTINDLLTTAMDAKSFAPAPADEAVF